MAETPSITEEARLKLKSTTEPEFFREISAHLRSRRALVYLVTHEEKRVLEFFKNFATGFGWRAFCWDCYNGMLNLSNMKPTALASANVSDPEIVLDWIVKEATETSEATQSSQPKFKGNIYLLWDFHRFLDPCTPAIERRLRTLARMASRTCVIIVGPHFITTPALEKDIALIDFPFPNEQEISNLLESTVDSFMETDPSSSLRKDYKKTESDIINAAAGLTLNEADSAFAKSVVMHKRFDIPTILKEKQQIIRKTGTLEYFQSDIGMENVGGLGNLIDWLRKRKQAFDPDAKSYGLPTPKGILIFGCPGTGKSLIAKAVAKEYNMPLLRLDFGSLFQSFIGESENNARKALKIAEAVAPTILWLDEIDKGISGIRSSGVTDGGVTARVFGTFLTWMEERKKPVFVVATANNVDNIPPEFMRAGRFDELFFVDIPNRLERTEIWKALLKINGRDASNFDVVSLVSSSDGYTGAEIKKAIDLAMFDAFSDNKREIATTDLMECLTRFIPINVSQQEYVARIREWAAERCVKANSSDTITGTINTRKDLDI